MGIPLRTEFSSCKMPCMGKRILHWTGRLVPLLTSMTLLIIVLPRLSTGFYAAGRVYPQPESPKKRVAIIFGAGLRYDGTPTAMLRDRVSTGADLYFSGQ